MKMELPVLAPSGGIIVDVFVHEGDAIDEDAMLVTIEAD
jgi:biotin carboxyl carrier protein